MAKQSQEVTQYDADSAPLPETLQYKRNVIIENDLRFDPACCGPGLLISDKNTVLKKNVDRNQWTTCRTMNAGWNQGVHYWSVRLMDRGLDGNIMIGIVSSNFDMSLSQYPGQTADSAAFYVLNGTKYRSAIGLSFVLELPQNNDVIGVLLDLEVRTLTFFKNGQSLGTAYAQLSLEDNIKYYPAIGLQKLGQCVSLIKTIQ